VRPGVERREESRRARLLATAAFAQGHEFFGNAGRQEIVDVDLAQPGYAGTVGDEQVLLRRRAEVARLAPEGLGDERVDLDGVVEHVGLALDLVDGQRGRGGEPQVGYACSHLAQQGRAGVGLYRSQ